MILPPTISKEFLNSYTEILNSVFEKSNGTFDDYGDARDELFKNKKNYKDIIPNNEIGKAIRSAKFGTYIVVKLGVRKTVFMDLKDNFYQVIGITQEPCDILEKWSIIETAVMKYCGYVIFDGIYRQSNCFIGSSIQKEILMKYKLDLDS
jgi:hypothetical protein